MKLLRNTLRANGIYSTVAGGAVAALAGPLAERMGVASIILLVVGKRNARLWCCHSVGDETSRRRPRFSLSP